MNRRGILISAWILGGMALFVAGLRGACWFIAPLQKFSLSSLELLFKTMLTII